MLNNSNFMRPFFTILALLFTSNILCQTFPLHEAVQDSIIGKYDENSYEIWEPNNKFCYSYSDNSFEFAFFQSLSKIVLYHGDTLKSLEEKFDGNQNSITQIELLLDREENLEVWLEEYKNINKEEIVSKTHMKFIKNDEVIALFNSNFMENDVPESLIESDENDESNFNLSDVKDVFNNVKDKLEPIADKVSNEPSEEITHEVSIQYSFEFDEVIYNQSYSYSHMCDFKCLVDLLKQNGYNFECFYKGGYLVWVSNHEK